MEPDPNPVTHLGLLAEIPGVMMESDLDTPKNAIEAVPVPDLAT